MGSRIAAQAPKARGAWTGEQYGAMSSRIQSVPKRSVRAISAFLAMVSGLHCSGWSCPVKKMVGDQARDPRKRTAYLRLRERDRRRGKEFGYVDESGFGPTVTRRYAAAPKGQRGSGLSSGLRRPRTSRSAARIGKTFEAPLLVEGTGTPPLCHAWREQELCPLLNDTPVVVMENVPFHKSATTQALITSRGAPRLFLPPSSPDLNPIEHDVATLKKRREYHALDTLDYLVKTYK